MAGLFGAPRRLPQVDTRAMGIMPGDQPTLGMGDSPLMEGAQLPRGGTPWPTGPQWPQLEQQRKPYQETLAGKLGMAGQILLSRGRYNPMMEFAARDQELQRRQQQAMQQRQWSNEDWLARQQWERANPAPRVNDTVEDYKFISQHLGPEAGQTYLRNRADPPQYRQGPDGQFYRVETAQPPTRPVGRLTPIDGGPGGSPSGAGFPNR